MSDASNDQGTAAVERGQVLFLAVGGQLVPVMARSVGGRRVSAVGIDGAEHALSLERFYWVGRHRVDDVASLRTYWAKVQADAAGVDLAGAWERLTADGPVEVAPPERLADLAAGGHDDQQVDAVVLAIFRDPTRFKVKRGQVQVASPEAVEAAARKAREEAERAQRHAWAVAALKRRLAGQGGDGQDGPEGPDETGRSGAIEEATRDAIGALTDLATFGPEHPRAAQALAVLDALGRRPPKADPGPAAFDLLVQLGELSRDENLFVRRAGVRTRFPDDVLTEAEALARRAPNQRAPRDMAGLVTVAVDDAATTEVDDAFALEGDVLHVFVADVASLVPRGSLVDVEAQARASTLYLPEGKIPMMPGVLADDACSLGQGETRPALCFSFEVLPDGRLGFLEIREASCRVDRRVTYDEADAVLAGAGAPGLTDAQAELLRRAATMMERHRQHRTRNGSMSFQRNEISFDIAPDGRVTVLRGDPNGPGRRLVSEMMIAVCAATGAYCRERGIPCVYRTQPPPDAPMPRVDAASLGPAEQVALLRHLKPSALTTRPAGHFSLGVDAYTQVTSPIRRYQDLLMHYQLKAVVRTGRPAMSDGQLMTLFSDVDKTAALLRRVEQDTRRFWALRWLEQNPDAVLDAVVLRELGRGRVVVEVGALALQATHAAGGRGRPRAGQVLKLKVAQVDARRDVLVLVEA